MKYQGSLAFEGYAIDDIIIYDEVNIFTHEDTDHGDEFSRFELARASAINTFNELYNSTLKRLGVKEAELFQTYKLMAEDLDFEDLVRSAIYEKKSAEEAVLFASNQLADTFTALDDDYMKQRAVDVKEVGKTILDILTGNAQKTILTKPTILVCDDISAATLMRFDPSLLKGLVLVKGNENSHAAIFARALEIPTLVSIKGGLVLSRSLSGHKAILDTIGGTLIIDPTDEEILEYSKFKRDYETELLELKKYIGKPSVTKDGVKIKIFANVASTLELASVARHDAEGIGLFRSEFIYLVSKDYPSEDLQFNYYREVLEEMNGKEAIIRTLDIGADKKVNYFNLIPEANPALGYRSIRICRDRPEMFCTQLRALYRASVYGKLSIMVPMIISLDEVKFVKQCVKKVQDDLTKNNIPFNKDTKVGIMIETPSAAIISDLLAKEVDFFSIGTNDLTQYALACDRLNPLLGKTYDPLSPAILRLIKLTVDNAHKAGIACSICGELGRNPKALPFLAKIHIDEISCSSAYVLKTRKVLSNIDTTQVDLNNYI